MTRADRLQPVQNIAEEAERRLAQQVAALEKAMRDAEAKLVDLERYPLLRGPLAGREDAQVAQQRLGDVVGFQEPLALRLAEVEQLHHGVGREPRELQDERQEAGMVRVRRLAPDEARAPRWQGSWAPIPLLHLL